VGNAVYSTLDMAHRFLSPSLRTGDLTPLRLCWLRARTLGRRRRPGSFRLPFGRVRYLDAWGLQYTYHELFVERAYDVAGLGHRPRILDCGANIGLATVRFKQLYPAARVIAFEADPAIAAVLKANVAALGLSDVEVVAAAVSDRAGRAPFEPDGNLAGAIAERGRQAVECVRLADWIDGPVDLLKLDIEGGEYDVIRDLRASGALEAVGAVICEAHGRAADPCALGELWNDLAGAGFLVVPRWAEAGHFLPGPPATTPFASVAGADFLAHIYAWRPD
jgi:FkbM family methyltransferase